MDRILRGYFGFSAAPTRSCSIASRINEKRLAIQSLAHSGRRKSAKRSKGWLGKIDEPQLTCWILTTTQQPLTSLSRNLPTKATACIKKVRRIKALNRVPIYQMQNESSVKLLLRKSLLRASTVLRLMQSAYSLPKATRQQTKLLSK